MYVKQHMVLVKLIDWFFIYDIVWTLKRVNNNNNLQDLGVMVLRAFQSEIWLLVQTIAKVYSRNNGVWTQEAKLG